MAQKVADDAQKVANDAQKEPFKNNVDTFSHFLCTKSEIFIPHEDS